MCTSIIPSSNSGPAKFKLPDLISHCPFELHISRHRRRVTKETRQWLCSSHDNVGDSLYKYDELKGGWATAMVYSRAAYPQFRVCNDFMTWLFHYDNLSDDMDAKEATAMADVVMNVFYHPERYAPPGIGRLTRDYWKRFIQTASPGTQQRFLETVNCYLQSVTEELNFHTSGTRIQSLESNISLRRDTSGTKTCFVMIEYAYNLTIPSEVMNHPLICSLIEAASDTVSWSNDIYSYNVEQSKGQNHNMVTVAMDEFGCDLQTAIDYIGKLCVESMDRFVKERGELPSWGSDVDQQLNVYLDGLVDWMVGNLHWSFKSHRYFGRSGAEVKKSRMVTLLPCRK